MEAGEPVPPSVEILLVDCSGTGWFSGDTLERGEQEIRDDIGEFEERQEERLEAVTCHLPCATIAHEGEPSSDRVHILHIEMGQSEGPTRVHFQAPAYLVDRLDAIAALLDKDRTDLLVEAIREYLDETADSEEFQQLVATKYYADQLAFETVKQLVEAETAQRRRLLNADLESEPFELAAPDDTDIYGDKATAPDDAASEED